MRILFLLLCLAVIAKTQTNYQTRIIYYDETENVCSYLQHSDVIRLNIKLEGFPLL